MYDLYVYRVADKGFEGSLLLLTLQCVIGAGRSERTSQSI